MAKPLKDSSKLFARALATTPGGVHSPVRAFGHVDGEPIFVRSAYGNAIQDTSGNSYTDFCMAFGPLILGHNHSAVNAALHAAIDDGWSYGTAEPYSLALAELIKSRIPWIDQIRFVNSGTEAVMTALRLARAVSGRNKILKFAGCYHGHVDSMLVAAGSGMASQPASEGVTADTVANTLIAPLDDESILEAIFAQQAGELAAVIIEPLPANYGLLPQRPEFLAALARLCRQHQVLLIFDEVISGFRVSFGGCAELYGIQPDIVTWGKIIGGGFPVGAFAARAEVMQRIAPLGGVYQAGTLSANPVAMRAGLATLEQLADGQIYAQLEALGATLENQLANDQRYKLQRQGSVFWIYPDSTTEVPRTPADVDQIKHDFRGRFSGLLAAGIYMAPSPYEVNFISSAHTSEDIEKLATVLNEWEETNA